MYPESTITLEGFKAAHQEVAGDTEEVRGLKRAAIGVMGVIDPSTLPGWLYCLHCGRPWWIVADPPLPMPVAEPQAVVEKPRAS